MGEKYERLGSLVPSFIGCFLLCAGGLKLYGIEAFSPQGSWLAHPTVQVATANWEIFLGFWLLSGVWGWAASLFALFTFLSFVAVNCYLLSAGSTTCACFGQVRASPWAALSVDLFLVAALGLWGFRAVRRRPLWSFEPLLAPLPSTCLIAVSLFLVSANWGVFAHGSLRAALANVMGQDLVLTEIDFGTVSRGQIVQGSFTLRNRTEKVARIIGASSYLRFAEDLPVTVPPGGKAVMWVRLEVPSEAPAGGFSGQAYLWTDCERSPVLHLSFSWRVGA